ncbi:extensin family protein [Agrobacterium salinitolerans]|nr:extensin family protein [Agrobacterium salinitolerans]
MIPRPRLLSLAMAAAICLGSTSYGLAAQGTDASAKKGDGEIVTEAENRSMGNSSANECIAQAESGGDPMAVNKSNGMLGKWQMSEAKLIDTKFAYGASGAATSFDQKDIKWSKLANSHGIFSTDDFLKNEAFQDLVKAEVDNWNSGKFNSAAKSMIGSTIDCSATGGSAATPLTNAMLVQGAQFGHGKVNQWASGGGSCVDGKDSATNDGNNKCVTYMMCKAANCSSVEKDMSKQTCSVVMPMIKAISCSNFTGQNLSLCNSAKPYLMTDGECAAAEAMSKEAPKGPNKEKCENLTFGPGTGSWSFALACSYASEAVADQDGAANSTTPVTPDDPACIAKLQSMGIQFTGNGSPRQNGSNSGVSCVVASSVQSRGTAVPFGVNLEMDCNMLYAMEVFGQKLKAIGVTGYYGMGATSECRRIRNNKTKAGGSMSWHGYGKAVDFSGVMVGDKKISMGLVNEPGTAAGQFALQIKSIACSTFSGVLTPTWENYKGDYFHNHVDIGGKYCK